MCQSFPTQALFSFLSSGKIVPKPPGLCISLLQQLPLLFSTSQDVWLRHIHPALPGSSIRASWAVGQRRRTGKQGNFFRMKLCLAQQSVAAGAASPGLIDTGFLLAALLSEGKVQQHPQKSSLRAPAALSQFG